MADDGLAVLGGAPRFSEPLHVGRPNVGDRARLLRRIEEILDRRWFTNHGVAVQELEARLTDLLGVRHCIVVANATLGLELMARALGLQGEVILPSFTFVATAHAMTWLGLRPVFCDVDPQTFQIDPSEVEQLVTPETSAILGVHVFGRPCPVEALQLIADRHRVPLVFDAAHALCCTHRGRPIGGFGRAEVFSFHATKFFNTFEGGAVATQDDALADQLRLMRNFGFAGADNVVSLGINAKLPEVSAAMGLTLLESLDEVVARNRENFQCYQVALHGLPGIGVVPFDPAERGNYQYVVVDVDGATCPLTRDELVRVLHAEQVLARRYFYPGCHRVEPYRTHGPFPRRPLAVTDRITQRLMSLPTGTAVGAAEIQGIGDIVRRALAEAPAVRRALQR